MAPRTVGSQWTPMLNGDAGQPFETHRSGWYPWDFGRRYRVHAWRVFPGHLTRYLRLPRLWQIAVLIGAREA